MHQKTLLIVVSIFFALLYAILSLVPHYNFQTNAFDLGIFNQAIYQYAHLRIGPNTIREVPSLFSDHFEPILLLLAPLYYLFKSYTLLIVQIAMTIFGAIGVFLLVKKETKKQFLAISATIIFYLFFGLLTALAFDYHNNTIATMLIPWIFLSIIERKIFRFYLFLALFLLCKENMALIAIFIGLSILLFHDRKIKKYGIITILISSIYFLISLKVISYLNGGQYDHWNYGQLGATPIEAIKNIIVHPLKTTWLLFDSQEKLKMWILLLASGGILAIFKGKYSILLIPILAQKFFAEDKIFWGYTYHYAVELAPIVAIGCAIIISKFSNKFQKPIAISFVVINLVILSQIHFYNGEKLTRILDKDYYITKYSRDSLETAINLIPKTAKVSAQNTIIPHIADRMVYLFPKVKDANYAIFNINDGNIWPIKDQQNLKLEIEKLKSENKYKTIYEKDGITILKLLSS